MQLIISYDWAEGQWLAGQEGQQPTHLALRSIHVELEKRKKRKRHKIGKFLKFMFLALLPSLDELVRIGTESSLPNP